MRQQQTMGQASIGWGFWAVVALVVAAHAVERPNLVLIMADDMGYECVRANGSSTFDTPALDALAQAGVRFEHCYSQPLCTPSRVQIMTGMYNIRNYTDFGTLDRTQTTFAHLLKQAGYATCIAGKWQLGRQLAAPQHFGFDQSCLWQQTRPARHKRRDTRYLNPRLEVNGKPVDYTNGAYGPDVVSDFICDFMTQHTDQPFLVYYPMIAPHSPFVPTPDSKDPACKDNQTNFQDMVAHIDKIVAKLDTTLKELGIRENTLLLFTGDNGTSGAIRSQLNGQAVQGGKGKMTDAGTHVPLIASWPGTIREGRVLQDLVDFSDFLPTLCDAAGVAVPASLPIDGQSFLPQLKGEPGSPREWAYCWYQAKDGTIQEWARTQRYKVYRRGSFYDVSQDAAERTPLTALSPEARAARTQLEAVLTQFETAQGSGLTPPRADAVASKPDTAGEVRPQNILLIMSDDLKASVLGAYGSTACRTPNLDRLAASGLVFERAYCQGLACAPSRPSMMRSIYPKSKAQAPTLGEHLQEHGMHTARVGKIFHMPVPDAPKNGTSGKDVPECWTEFHNTQSEETFTPGLYRLMTNGTASREMNGRQGAGTRLRMYTAVESDQADGADQADHMVATKAIELLQQRQAAGKPFFLGVGFFRPHYPMVAPKKFFDMYPRQTLKIPPLVEGDLDDIPEAGRAHHTLKLEATEAGRRGMWQAYYASVTFMDEQVGRVLAELDRLGLRESTTIVFTTDHGYHLGEHGFWQKMNLHEEVARVPFIMSGPGVKAGRTESLVELVDFYPTCTDLLGLPTPDGLHGKSLVSILQDPASTVRDTALSIHVRKDSASIRAAGWHYMSYGEDGDELYDMVADPGQFTNLVHHPEYAETLKRARKALAQRLAEAQ